MRSPERQVEKPLNQECNDSDHFSNLLTLMGASLPPSAPCSDWVPVALQRVHEGQPLYHEGMVANAIHFVRAGTFKSFHITEDGYEQVVAFVNRTEILGYDALHGGRHPTAAVALEESSVYSLPMSEVFSLSIHAPELDRVLRIAVSSQLQRYSELADLMSSVAAEARLSRFLLQLSQRMRSQDQSPTRFYLRMSRRDIASYLGVAHETISRGFGLLARCGYIAVKRREVDILDVDGLKACALGYHRFAYASTKKNRSRSRGFQVRSRTVADVIEIRSCGCSKPAGPFDLA